MDKIQYKSPLLAIVTGVPGSGKSLLCIGYDHTGRKIGLGILDHISAVYIDKDRIRSSNPELSRHVCYQIIKALVTSNVRVGNSVVVDATFAQEVTNPRWADEYSNIAQEVDGYLRILRCVSSEDVIIERLRIRGRKIDLEKLADPQGFFKREPVHVRIPHEGIEIDTSGSLEENVNTALKFLNHCRR